jgi:hypothetical protein
METGNTFERALTQMKEWKNVQSIMRNWLNKQKMFVSVQEPDENSKMNEPYLYMTIEKKDESIIRRPRMPSMLDLFSNMWTGA